MTPLSGFWPASGGFHASAPPAVGRCGTGLLRIMPPCPRRGQASLEGEYPLDVSTVPLHPAKVFMEGRGSSESVPVSFAEILLAAAIPLWALVILLRNGPSGLFIDPDSYMHLARFLEGNGIFSGGFFPRDNAPYGTVVPWTMPMDGALALFYALGRAFTDPSGALYFAARVVSPFLCATIGPVIFFGFRPFFSLRARVVMAGLAATAPALIFFSLPGDADHHAMVVWLSALFFIAVVRYLFLDRARFRHAVAVGIAAAVALWTSPEEFIVIGTGLSAIVLHRCMVETPNAGGTRAKDLVLAGAFAITLTTAWLVDRPYEGLWAPDVDRLSIVYVSFAWLFSAALIALDAYLWKSASFSTSRNLMVAALLGGTAFLCWVAIHPGILRGPLGQVNRIVSAELIDHNLEMRPLWRIDKVTVASWIILILIWASFGVLIAKSSAPQRRLWIACAVLMIPISLMGIRFYRSINFAEILGSIPLGLVLAQRTRRYPKYMGYSAVAASACVMLGVLGATRLLWDQLEPSHANTALAAPDCGPTSLSEAVTPILNTDAIVLTELDFAPMLLYLSPELRTVATPYVRNTQGITDVLAFFDAQDDDEARAILAQRGVQFVLVCDRGERRRADSLAERIFHQTPNWLQRVGSDAAHPGFRLYRVRSGAG